MDSTFSYSDTLYNDIHEDENTTIDLPIIKKMYEYLLGCIMTNWQFADKCLFC